MILLALTASLIAAPSDDYRAGLESRADGAVAKTHFRRAADGFEAEWNAGNHSPELACNMAQARFLSGDIGRAVRDYRRGLRGDPHNRELQRGLENIRGQIVFPVAVERGPEFSAADFASPFDHLMISRTAMVWSVIGLAGVGWLTLARGWHASRRGTVWFGVLIIVFAAGLGAALAWDDHRLRTHWNEPAVVIVSSTDLRTGNSDEYPRRVEARLPAGTELRKIGERGGWFQVELADGTPGWVNGAAAVEVE